MVTALAREPAGVTPAGSRASVPPSVEGPAAVSVLVQRVRLMIVCLGFLGLTLSQSPGLLVGDTKLDLVVDPVGFLGRALQLWEPQGFAGQVQNQAYGYLFPMGPFFALGSAVGVPMWVVQRLWWALLLSVAFLGVVVLARRLRIGTPLTGLVAGLAYALAPRMLSALGATSVELIPMALAPWVLVPLVGAAALRSPRRAAALSALAVFCVGGVNAVATAAVLPLPVLWLLTRPAGPLRRRLAAWWSIAVALAITWWVGPLLLLGRYSGRFLDYIESAATTTAPTDVLSVLRGTSHWVATLASPSGPIWPAGWALVHEAGPVVGTLVLAVAGLVGLTCRNLPERSWLALGVLAGTALVALGHLATVEGVLAGPLHDALDGVLAPLRNAHKFDPVLRLPLILGMTHLVSVLVRRGQEDASVPAAWPEWARRSSPQVARALVVVLALALVATTSPAVTGRLVPFKSFERLPEYWYETADFLADAAPTGRALLVPGSSFGIYDWGRPNDEPMQPLARSPWEVRNAIPLTPTAHIRMLDAVESRLARGEGSTGLARYLARSGISHLVLRNDLDNGAAGSTRSVLVRQALRDSPGIQRVATFGPDFPGVTLDPGLVLDAGLEEPAPAIEIYTVDAPAPRAWTAPVADAVAVAGGPDAVLALEDRGLLTDRPTVLVGDVPPGVAGAMVSDALLRRERAFGRLRNAVSAGLSADDPRRVDHPSRDYPVPGIGLAESVVRYGGGTPSASGSASDVDSFSGALPDASPWAALDADVTTAWRPPDVVGAAGPVWWRLDTVRPFRAQTVTIRLAVGPDARPPHRVRLSTDAGTRTVRLRNTPEPQRLELPAGSSRSLTITSVPRSDRRAGASLALAEVTIPGVSVSRTVVTPAPTTPADVYAFDASGPRSTGCVIDADEVPRCAGTLVTGAEEPGGLDRVFTTLEADDYGVALTATPRPGPALDALLAASGSEPVEVRASSAVVPDPRGSAVAAIDGDPDTAWLAASSDRRPSLVLSWPEPREIGSLRVILRPGLAAAFPTAVTLDGGGLSRNFRLGDDGRVEFEPFTTDRLVVTFQLPLELRSFDPYSRSIQSLGMGVSELEVGGAVSTPDRDATVELPCGEGPVLTIDGVQRQTRLSTTVGALRRLEPVELGVCGGRSEVALPAGAHRFVAGATDLWRVSSATLTRAGSELPTAAEREAVEISRWDAEHRSMRVVARDQATLLVVPENTNPGWVATLDGQRLEAVDVDGWQQGYLLPAGPDGTVSLDFGPGPTYRTALGGGLAALLLLVVLALVPPRRKHRIDAPRGPGPRAALIVGAGVLGTALVGGVVGLAALLVAAGVAALVGTRRWAAMGALTGACAGSAGLLLLIAPSGTGTARQVLAIVAVAAIVVSVWPPFPVPESIRHRGGVLTARLRMRSSQT